jgi:hypothetical protein
MAIKLKIMKKMLMIFAIAAVFAACKSDSKADLETNKVILSDSSMSVTGSASSDTGTAVVKGTVTTPVARSTRSTKTSTSGSNNNTAASNTGSSTTTTTTTSNTTKKKGWSSRAKGAVIGGVAGAVGGAVISKHNKGTGAAVGGVVGAAGGYIIGNEVDKKNGR